MSNKEKDLLKEKIKKAIKQSSQRLVEKKKALRQTLVVSKDGKIEVINPWLEREGEYPFEYLRARSEVK